MSDHEQQQLILRKFNPQKINEKRKGGHSPIIVMIGKRGSGKSSIVIDILEYIQDIPAVVVFSATEESNGCFGKYVHEIFIHTKFDVDTLEKIINKQKDKILKLRENGIDPKTCSDVDICIIFDDLNYDNKLLKNKNITEILFNGRHLHITFIMTLQFMMAFPPSYRSQIDYVFICRETKRDNIKRLFEYYSVFDDIKDFSKVLSNCTENYGCLVIDNIAKSEKIEDQVFWYKARLKLDFRIGTTLEWQKYDFMLQLRRNQQLQGENNNNNKNKKGVSSLIIKKIE